VSTCIISQCYPSGGYEIHTSLHQQDLTMDCHEIWTTRLPRKLPNLFKIWILHPLCYFLLLWEKPKLQVKTFQTACQNRFVCLYSVRRVMSEYEK